MAKDFTVDYRATDSSFGSQTQKVQAQLRMLGTEVGNLANRELTHLQNRMAAFFSVDFLAHKIEEAMRFADSMQALSDMTQISVESLQELEFAARQAGTPFEAVIAAIRNLERSRVKALSGDKADLASFERLSITMEDLKKQSGEALFHRIANAVGEASYSAQQLTDVLNVMGRGASTLFPLFNAGLSDLVTKARSASVVMGTDMIKALDDLGDQMEETSTRFRMAFGLIGGSLAWTLNKLTQLVELASGFGAAFIAGWLASKSRLDGLVSGKGFFAAMKAYPDELRSAYGDALKAVQEDWDRLMGKTGPENKKKERLNDQSVFEEEQNRRRMELQAKNDEKSRELKLKEMAAEERINELIRDRLQLRRLMETSRDSLEFEQLRELQLKNEEELIGARAARAAALRSSAGASSAGRSPLDELSRAGFFTFGRPLETLEVNKQQLAEMRRLIRTTEAIPAGVANSLQ